MWLFVGLGNPGKKYEKNRHNIGFMAVDHMSQNYGMPSYKSKFQAHITEGRIGKHKVVLLKPQTYMNESGISVSKTAKFYKIPPENIVVLHDELDIPTASCRIKKGGGNAGHNGLKSVQAHLGTADFWRIRIGIDHPGDRNRVSHYVLSDFAKSEMQQFEPLIDIISDHVGLICDDDVEKFEAMLKK